MAENTKYPDLRYKLIRGLVSFERFQRKRHWLKQAAEWTSKAIISLDLTFDVIKSVRQAMDLDGIGSVIATKLREIAKSSRYSVASPECGKFTSSAPALLVALYLLREDTERHDVLDGGKTLVPGDQLRQVAMLISEEPFVDEKGDNDLGFCQAWWRLNVLANRGYLKKRTRNKLPVFEMLPAGERLTKQLIVSAGLDGISLSQLMYGEMVSPRLRSIPPPVTTHNNPAHDHLYTNDDGSDGLVLYVDIREWGGDRLGLVSLCRRLEETGVRYATRHLATGDYSWVWTCGGRRVELPLLVERKRADDLAHSMRDGRYGRQREKMLAWREKYDILQLEATLSYVVEGDPLMYVVQCADGCGGVGRCGNPTVDQVKEKIEEINTSGDFSLVQTADKRGTVDLIVAMTQELQVRINNGDFINLQTHTTRLEKAGDNNAVYSKPPTSSTTATRKRKVSHTAINEQDQGGKGNDEEKHWTDALSTGYSSETNSPYRLDQYKCSTDNIFSEARGCPQKKDKKTEIRKKLFNADGQKSFGLSDDTRTNYRHRFLDRLAKEESSPPMVDLASFPVESESHWADALYAGYYSKTMSPHWLDHLKCSADNVFSEGQSSSPKNHRKSEQIREFPNTNGQKSLDFPGDIGTDYHHKFLDCLTKEESSAPTVDLTSFPVENDSHWADALCAGYSSKTMSPHRLYHLKCSADNVLSEGQISSQKKHRKSEQIREFPNTNGQKILDFPGDTSTDHHHKFLDHLTKEDSSPPPVDLTSFLVESNNHWSDTLCDGRYPKVGSPQRYNSWTSKSSNLSPLNRNEFCSIASSPQHPKNEFSTGKCSSPNAAMKFTPSLSSKRRQKRRVHEIDLSWLDTDDPAKPTSIELDRFAIKLENKTSPTQQQPDPIQTSFRTTPYRQPVVKSEPRCSDSLFAVDVKKEDVVGVVLESWTEEIRSIRMVLPDVDEDVARDELDRYNGDVDRTVSALLDRL